MVFLTMHNMALCFQKLGALEECALCLEASISTLNSPFLSLKLQSMESGFSDPSKKLKRLKYECKTHMQVCALLSQLHRHKEALVHAERSVQIAQYMIEDMHSMCSFYYQKVLIAKRNEQITQDIIVNDQAKSNPNDPACQLFKDLIYYDDSVSMLERTAYRVYPIIQECASKLISNDETIFSKHNMSSDQINAKPKINMKAVLGYLNQSEWLYLLNIGNIMQITPMTVHDLYTNTIFEVELTRESILEKISFLSVSYFCISTELRFLYQIKGNNIGTLEGPNQETAETLALRKKESEYWHAKALDVAISFLPSECPLVTHILTSYQKNHAPVHQEIPEDKEAVQSLKVIRPLSGIDVAKFQPIVRQDPFLKISIAPLSLSPNNYHFIKDSLNYNNNNKQSNNQQHFSSHQCSISPNNQQVSVQGTVGQIKRVGSEDDLTHARPRNKQKEQLQVQSLTLDCEPSKAIEEQEECNEKNQRHYQEEKEDDEEEEIEEEDGQFYIGQFYIEGEDYDQNSIGQQNLSNHLFNNNSMMEIVPSHKKRYRKLLQEYKVLGATQDNGSFVDDKDGLIPRNISNRQSKASDQKAIFSKAGNKGISDKASQKPRVTNQKQRGQEQKTQNWEGSDEDFDQQEDEEEDEEEDEIRGGGSLGIQRQMGNGGYKHHNISFDGPSQKGIKRPKTSQGMKKQDRNGGGAAQPPGGGPQKSEGFTKLVDQVKYNSVLPQAASVDRISPHTRPSGRQHQSMAAAGPSTAASVKLIKHPNQQMVAQHNTMQNFQSAAGVSKGRSDTRTPTPHRQQESNGKSGGAAFRQSQLGMLIQQSNSRSQIHHDQHQQLKTNQSSQSEIVTGGRKRSTSRGATAASGTKQKLRNTGTTTALTTTTDQTPPTQGTTKRPQVVGTHGKSQYQQILASSSASKNSGGMDSQSRRQMIAKEIDSIMRGTVKNAAAIDVMTGTHGKSFDSTSNNINNQSMTSFSQSQKQSRGKSRGNKTGGTGARSKERSMKIRYSNVATSDQIEELKNQNLLKQSLAQPRKRSNSPGTTAAANGKEPLAYRLSNAHQILAAQQQTQQWLQQNPLIPQHFQTASSGTVTGSQINVNTHSMIKKFLKDRGGSQIQTQQAPSVILDSYSMNGGNMGQQQQNYKYQLSKKILQQQQKLMMLSLNNGGNSNVSGVTNNRKEQQHSGGIKRSSTPMLEMNDHPSQQILQPRQKQIIQAQQFSIPALKLHAILNGGGIPSTTNLHDAQMIGANLIFQPQVKAMTPDLSSSGVQNDGQNSQQFSSSTLREDSMNSGYKSAKKSKIIRAAPKGVGGLNTSGINAIM